jgi:hypothetical protein
MQEDLSVFKQTTTDKKKPGLKPSATIGSLLDPDIQYVRKQELEQFKDYVKEMIKDI